MDMDCAKGTAVAGLYDEVMVEILSRVPVKDLRRSTCVSKPWRDFSQSQDSHMHYFSQLSVWFLEDHDTQEWILKHNVSTSQLFGLPSCLIDNFDIVAVHPDHNSIILVQASNQKLVLYEYDMDSKELHALRTLGEGYLFLIPYVPCFMESSVLAIKD